MTTFTAVCVLFLAAISESGYHISIAARSQGYIHKQGEKEPIKRGDIKFSHTLSKFVFLE